MLSTLPRSDYTGLDDTQLAHCVAKGDHAAFAWLMRRFNRPLFRTARSIVKDDAAAEDVVQESYLLAYRSIGGFRGDARLSTWLTRIVVNEAIARVRKDSRRARVIVLNGDTAGTAPGEAVHMDDTQDDGGANRPETQALRAETRRLIERRIDALPQSFRTVFVLRSLEELSVEETAACLGIPEATVRTRYFRARGLLREALSRELDFAMDDAFSFAGKRCDRIVAGVLARLPCPEEDAGAP